VCDGIERDHNLGDGTEDTCCEANSGLSEVQVSVHAHLLVHRCNGPARHHRRIFVQQIELGLELCGRKLCIAIGSILLQLKLQYNQNATHK
jgi:hypothetical protein